MHDSGKNKIEIGQSSGSNERHKSEKIAELLFSDAKPGTHWEEKYPSRELPKGAYVTRFAPSPTGFLHVGGVMQALTDEAEAKRSGGVFILRIEDTDRARFVEGAEEAIYDGLDWAGVHVDEGGREKKGNYGPYKQSERLETYLTYAKELIKNGFAYPCFCTSEELQKVREEQERTKQPRMYSGTCRDLSEKSIEEYINAGKRFTVRLKVPEGETVEWNDLTKKNPITWDTKNIDDQVLLKSDGFPTYHLANVVDDHLMGVNRVYRGEEWISSTPKHLLMYKALGWKAPEFGHLVLLRELETQQKLSKRKGEAGLEWYKKEGYAPEALRNFLTRIMWAHPEGRDVYPHEDFIRGFDVHKMGEGAPQVNPKLLEHINQEYLARLDPEKRLEEVVNWAKAFEPEFAEICMKHRDDAERYLGIEPERMKKLSEAKALFGFYFSELYVTAAREELLSETAGDEAKMKEVLTAYVNEFYGQEDGHDAWQAKVRKLASRTGLKDKNIFMLLRKVLTGSKNSPPLYEVMQALGGEEVLKRINAIRQKPGTF
ncbi:MAG: Glutamate-tRNA ligase [Parcubacteria group bacterium GW2011_GWA2_47_10]|nr:MAG: Glutamate-tRNA ligase [Parcubacteria group bacterium GW2011_GWA2_47_10]